MSNVGDALSGSGGNGVTDATGSSSFGDTPNITDATFSGLTDADVMGMGSAGSGGFNSFNNLVSALSGSGGGAGPTGVSAPTPAAATGGDPVGAASGTQSATTPGSTPANSNQQGGSGGGSGSGGQSQDGQHAPPSAVAELKTLLKGLSGQPAGPTGFTGPTVPASVASSSSPLATLAAGQTGPQSTGSFYGTPVQPQTTGVNEIAGSAPAAASIQPGAAQQPTADAAAGDGGAPATDAQGNPVTAAGTPAADTPLPPSRPGAAVAGDDRTTQIEQGGGGRAITVKKGAGAQPVPTADLPTRVSPGSAAHPLPTKKPGASPAPAATPAASQLIQDVTGASTGSPTALADLAQAAKVIIPLLPMLAGMFGGGGGRRGHFRGGGGFGRFGGYRGGMNAMHYHGGQHPSAPGAWPYHHPQFGWHMHGRPPGQGWLPLNPMDARAMVGGGQGGAPGQADPNAPPKETGKAAGPADATTSGAIPGESAKDVDSYTRQVATSYGIDPDVASKILGQESSYGQATKPGDNGTSFGPFQLHLTREGNAMGDQFMRDTGLDPRDPRTWKQQVDYAMMKASTEGWTPWTTTMKKLGMNQWSGITTNRRYAGRMSNKPLPQETTVTPDMIAKLPVTSQPIVAGGP
jgi:hypothetical protein